MSFLSDLFEGNTSNLGNDLAPSSVFSDFGADAGKALSNPAVDIGLGATALFAAPFLAPELFGAAGGAGLFGAAEGGLGAAEAAGAAVPAGLGDFSYLDAIPGLAGGDVTIGTPAVAGGEVGAMGAIGPTGVPGAGGAFDGAGTAATMGGGGNLTVAGAGGAPGGSTLPNADWMSGITLDSPTTAYEGGAATPANPMTGGAFGSPSPAPGAPAGATPDWIAQNMPWLSTAAGAVKTVSPLLGVAGLGNALYQGYQSKQQMAKLNQQEATAAGEAAQQGEVARTAAAPLLNQGSTLMSYLTSGTLPKVFQDQVKGQIDAARASIIQGYATRGMSSDPRQNSSLAQDLNNLNLKQEELQTQLETMLADAGNKMVQTANSLLSSGLQATQLSAELPIQVAQLNVQLNASMSNAIANFAAAINGGRNLNAGNVGKGGGISLTP